MIQQRGQQRIVARADQASQRGVGQGTQGRASPRRMGSQFIRPRRGEHPLTIARA
jgi:hypothetical protein